MQVSPDTISLKEWLSDSSLKECSLRNRVTLVKQFEKANGSTFDRILSDIVSDNVSVYSTCKTYLDYIRKNHTSYTVYTYRSMLPGLFQSVLGEENFRRTVFDRLVPSGTFYITRNKKVPTESELKHLLEISNPEYRAIIGVLACTGMRIRECLSRKISDIEVREEGYGKVKLQPSETKARYQRSCFITKEVLGWITAYRTWLGTNSEWVFPGEIKGWLQYDTVLDSIKGLYRKIGLLDKPDKTEIYCIHSFRTFADSYMRNLGLDSKYVSAIIGHRNRLQAESHYLDWNQIEKSWTEKCAQASFLGVQDTDSKEKIERLEKHNGKLEALLERLLERLS